MGKQTAQAKEVYCHYRNYRTPNESFKGNIKLALKTSKFLTLKSQGATPKIWNRFIYFEVLFTFAPRYT